MSQGLFKKGDESTELMVDYVFIDSTDKLLAHKSDIFNLDGVIGLDTETNGLDPHTNRVLMLQLSDGCSSFVIDTRTTDILILKEFLETGSFVAHYATFDYSMLKKSFDIALSNIYCTMVGEQIVSAGKRFGESYKLNAVANKRLGIVLDKDPATSFLTIGDAPFSEIQKLYGARDAFILPEIRNQQLMDVDEYGLHKIVDLEMGCIIPIAEMQLRGCVVDQEKWMFILKYAHIFENRVGRKLKEVFEEVDTQPTLFGLSSINLNSQPQLLKMLRKFGLDLESTSSGELEDHLGEHTAVDWLLEYRTYEKVRAAYGDELLKKINKVTKRLHPKFNQAHAKTGRMSSCFPKGTPIETNKGIKPIEEIVEGDFVITRNGYKKVLGSFYSGKSKLRRIKLNDRSELLCTRNHRVLANSKWTYVMSLKPGDKLYKVINNTTIELVVKSIEVVNKRHDVYDLAVDGEEFLVNKFVVHNSNPNAQNIPAPKEFEDKLVELPKSELPKEFFESEYTKPIAVVTDKDAPSLDRYSLVYEKGVCKYYIDSNETAYIYVYDFRDCFIAAPGYKIVQCDMPKAEICIMAHMSQDGKLIEAINSGEDVYKRAAAESLRIPYETVTSAQRKIYKAVVLGLAYGLSSFGLARNIKITEDHANEVIDTFKMAFPVLNKWLEQEGRAALMRCYALTQLGRRLFLPFDVDPTENPQEAEFLRMSNERRGKNQPMQGGNADLTKLALAMIHKEVSKRKLDAGLQLVVHDEFVGEAIESQAEEMGQIMVDKVQEVFKIVYPSVIVKPEYNIGDYWMK